MEETLLQTESLSTTQKNIQSYFNTHDVQYVAEDAVFLNMGTGEETKGREAIAQMLHYIYHIAFDARAEVRNYIITEDKALLEADFKGTHIGEFAGIPQTGRQVNVPLCVSYKLENGLIKEGRIYMLGEVMMRQLQSNV